MRTGNFLSGQASHKSSPSFDGELFWRVSHAASISPVLQPILPHLYVLPPLYISVYLALIYAMPPFLCRWLSNRIFPASYVSYYTAAHLSSISPIFATYPTSLVRPATTVYICISGSYLCQASFSMLVAVHTMPLSTSCP